MKFTVEHALCFIIALDFKAIDRIYFEVSVLRCIGVQYIVYSLEYTIRVSCRVIGFEVYSKAATQNFIIALDFKPIDKVYFKGSVSGI